MGESTEVAHDLSNLITAILGFARLARANAVSPQAQGDIDRVIEAATRAASLLDELIEMVEDLQDDPSA